MPTPKKLLVVQVAALGYDFHQSVGDARLAGLEIQGLPGFFPGLTCPVQATLRTAAQAGRHGMVANGLFNRELAKPMFWEQSAQQVAGTRIWDAYRNRGGTVGMLFWQQSLGESIDVVLSPAPVHTHHGGLIQACVAKPRDLYTTLCRHVGRPFRLQSYWGPLASTRSSRWIANATCSLLAEREHGPDLLFSYLPGLDYDLQRYGPAADKSRRALVETRADLEKLITCAQKNDYEVVIFGDYAIVPCHTPIMINHRLRQAGLLSCRRLRGMAYLDLYHSRAFALVDHELAHVYIRHAEDIDTVRGLLVADPHIEQVMTRAEQGAAGTGHANAGELLAVAADGAWFAYHWWEQRSEAPDFAGHVDIHNKPGYDPCELFFGWPPGSVSQNAARIRGTHGKATGGRDTVFASTCLPAPSSLVELGKSIATWLNA